MLLRVTSDPRTDSQLVDAINRGEMAAFDELYFRHRDWVVRLAWRITGSDEEALDVLQDTFGYVFRKFPGFRLSAAMTTFLYPVVKNLSIAARRKRRRSLGGGEMLDGLPAAPHTDNADASRLELATVMALLSDGHREVVLMRFVDGLNTDEIATALEIPAGTVKSRLHNALETLRADPRTRRYFEIEGP